VDERVARLGQDLERLVDVAGFGAALGLTVGADPAATGPAVGALGQQADVARALGLALRPLGPVLGVHVRQADGDARAVTELDAVAAVLDLGQRPGGHVQRTSRSHAGDGLAGVAIAPLAGDDDVEHALGLTLGKPGAELDLAPH